MVRCARPDCGRFLALVLSVGAAACDAAPASRAARPAADTARVHAAPAATAPSPAGDSFTVTVYFIRGEQPVPVSRTLPATPDTLRAALTALLAGPTTAETESGLTSWFSSATADALRSVRIADGVAIVDLRDLSDRIPNASSSLGSTMLLDALNRTVFAGVRVDSVEYRFDGSCAAFGEFVQRGCIRYGRAAED